MEGASGSAAGDEQMKASEAASSGLECSTNSRCYAGTGTNDSPAPPMPSTRPRHAESSAEVDPRSDTCTMQRPHSTPPSRPSQSPELSPTPHGSTNAGNGTACDLRAAESAWAASTNRPAWPGEETDGNATRGPSGTTSTAPPMNRAFRLTPNSQSGTARGMVTSARHQQAAMHSEQVPVAMSKVPTLSTEVGISVHGVTCANGGVGDAQSVACLFSGEEKYANSAATSRRMQMSPTGEMTPGDVTLSRRAPRAMATGETIERSGASVACHVGQDEAKYGGEDQRHAALRAATASIGSLIGAGSSPPASECTRRGARYMPNRVDMGALPNVGLPPPAKSPGGLAVPDIFVSEGASAAAAPRTPPQALTSGHYLPTAAGSSYVAIAPVSGPRGGATNASLLGDSGGYLTMTSSVGGEGPSAESSAPLSGDERTRRVKQEQTGPPPWGEPVDTADVALAAASYASAVAEAEVVGGSSSGTTAALESADGQIRPISSHCGGSSTSDTVEHATANYLGTPLGPPQEYGGEMTVSTAATAASATPSPASRTASHGEGGSVVVETSCGSAVAPAPVKCRDDGSESVSAATRGKKRSRASDHHEDLMQAMCMICLEKLSESSEGGGAKLLGLLDSCSHRYCYTCILEWSKITNKCPQCKARFHTIKAVKELRRSNDRYRGIAVRVEDRDQVYSFVDVRDVVVMDPEVACRAGCLVRRGVDASQQGWEFSVQCERCSNWYHGLCVGFRQESEVPDLWFCESCRGESSQAVSNPDTTTEAAATDTLSRQSSSGNRGNDRRQSIGQSSEGQSSVALSVSGQGGAVDVGSGHGQGPEQDSNDDGVPGLSRTVLDGRSSESGSRGDTEVSVANVDAAQPAPVSSALPASARRVQPPPPRSPPVAGAPRDRAAPNGLPQSLNLAPLERMLALFGAQQSTPTIPPPRPSLPPAISAPPLSASRGATPARVRGRPRRSKNKQGVNPPEHPAAQASATQPERRSSSPPLAQPPVALSVGRQQQQQHQLPPALPEHLNSAPPLSVSGMASPAQIRGRTRGSKNKPRANPPEHPAATASEAQPERRSAPTPSTEPPVSPLLEDRQKQEESSHISMAMSLTAVGATGLQGGAGASSAPFLSAPVGASSGPLRDRPRGSENEPRANPPEHPAATALETRPERRSALPPWAEPPVSPMPEDQQQQEESAHNSAAVSLTAVDAASLQDVIPQPPQPPSPSLLRSLEASQATELCEICGFDTEPENLIVYCESCNMGVHQTCYGISEIPTKAWYCSPCAAGVHPSTLECRFCPVKGGALKSCTDGSWGHILCAFWIPECCFLDPQKMEPIGSINRRGQAGGIEKFLPSFRSRKCYVCGTSEGSAIRCHTASCKFHLHPMCGSKAGSVYMEIETTTKRGTDGTEHESVNLVARCPRHNKNKTSGSRAFKSCDASASAADPLSVVGKSVEITDPERSDVALAGKVTWFDPDRSRYCIVESCPRSGGNSSGCGQPKKACAHWITVEKLIEAKAMGVQKNGNTFLLEPLPALEREEAEMNHESAIPENRVKIEQIEEEVELGGEGVALSMEEKGDSKQVQHEKADEVAAVELEKTTLGEEDTGGAMASKRRRMDARSSPISPSDDAPTKRTVCLEARPHQATVPLQLDSQPRRPELVEVGEASRSQVEGSQPFIGNGVGSESGMGARSSAEIETPSPVTRPRSQQQARLLPSVQLQDQSDPFSRYPIRGRLRRPTNPGFNPIASRVLEGVPSRKRPRVEGGVDHSLAVPTGADPFPAPLEGLACPRKTAVVAGSSLHSTPSEVSSQVSFRETPQARCSTKVQTVSEAGVQPCQHGSTCDLMPGWAYGMKLLGQAPVTRVRAVHLPGGREATYFASAYSSVAESTVFVKRSAPRFSFRFEHLEEMEMTDLTKYKRQQGTNTDSLNEHPERCPDGARAGRERGDVLHGSAVNKTREGEAPPAPRVGVLGREEEERANDMEEETTPVDQTGDVSSDGDCAEDQTGDVSSDGDCEEDQTGDVSSDGDCAEDQTGHVSSDGDCAEDQTGDVSSDGDCAEDQKGDVSSDDDCADGGEIDNGRADAVSPSRGSEESVGDGVERALDSGVQGAAEGTGSKGLAAQTACQSDINQPNLSGDGERGTSAEGVEDMDLSSDGVSCGGFEGAEAASPCLSETYDRDGFDMGWVTCGSPCQEGAHNPSMLGVESASPEPSSSKTGIPQALDEQLCAETGGAVEEAESSVDGNYLDEVSEDASPKAGKSTEFIAKANMALPTTSEGGGESRLESQTEAATQRTGVTLALRSIVREQLQGALKSASKGGEAALAGENGNDVLERIASAAEGELFRRLYEDSTGGREYKAKYKQLLLSLGNVRNYRLVASVLAGNTTPVDLATKDAVGLLNSLSSSLNCLAIPLAGRHRQSPPPGSPVGSPTRKGHTGNGKRRGKMMLL